MNSQAWHDANDVDQDGQTVDQKVEASRHARRESERLGAAAAERLRSAPPCPLCGAGWGEPCRKLTAALKAAGGELP
jgi:hypothetical protein